MNRRSFLGSILLAGAAPAIVRADSLMRVVPVDPWREVADLWIPDERMTASEVIARRAEAFQTTYREEFIRAFEQHNAMLRTVVLWNGRLDDHIVRALTR